MGRQHQSHIIKAIRAPADRNHRKWENIAKLIFACKYPSWMSIRTMCKCSNKNPGLFYRKYSLSRHIPSNEADTLLKMLQKRDQEIVTFNDFTSGVTCCFLFKGIIDCLRPYVYETINSQLFFHIVCRFHVRSQVSLSRVRFIRQR